MLIPMNAELHRGIILKSKYFEGINSASAGCRHVVHPNHFYFFKQTLRLEQVNKPPRLLLSCDVFLFMITLYYH